jgi:hypothetical protein
LLLLLCRQVTQRLRNVHVSRPQATSRQRRQVHKRLQDSSKRQTCHFTGCTDSSRALLDTRQQAENYMLHQLIAAGSGRNCTVKSSSNMAISYAAPMHQHAN